MLNSSLTPSLLLSQNPLYPSPALRFNRTGRPGHWSLAISLHLVNACSTCAPAASDLYEPEMFLESFSPSMTASPITQFNSSHTDPEPSSPSRDPGIPMVFRPQNRACSAKTALTVQVSAPGRHRLVPVGQTVVSELAGESKNPGQTVQLPWVHHADEGSLRLPAAICTLSSSEWPEFHSSICECT